MATTGTAQKSKNKAERVGSIDELRSGDLKKTKEKKSQPVRTGSIHEARSSTSKK